MGSSQAYRHDTHMPKTRPDQEIRLVPIDMNVSLLERGPVRWCPHRWVDFPFALIEIQQADMAFEQDLDTPWACNG